MVFFGLLLKLFSLFQLTDDSNVQCTHCRKQYLLRFCSGTSGHVTSSCDSDTDELFVVSAEAGLRHRVLPPPTRQIFHYDRSVAAEIVELTP